MARREWVRVYRMASSQYGVFSRRQALALGMSASAIDRFVRSGAWVRVRPGVYQIAAVPITWKGDLMAAWLWAGEGALVSHRSAGRIWGLDGIPQGSAELCVRTARRGHDVILHRLQPGDDPRSRMLQGFRVTSIDRTLLDLSAVCRPSAAGLAMDDALRKRLTTLPRLKSYREEMARCGRDGTRLFGGLLAARDERDAATANRFEKRLLRTLRRIEGHRLVAQHRVDDGAQTYYLDFAFPV